MLYELSLFTTAQQRESAGDWLPSGRNASMLEPMVMRATQTVMRPSKHLKSFSVEFGKIKVE